MLLLVCGHVMCVQETPKGSQKSSYLLYDTAMGYLWTCGLVNLHTGQQVLFEPVAFS